MEKKTKTKQEKRPTPRQELAAKAYVKNLQLDKPKPIGEVLKSVGYGTGLQNQPARVIESEGFQSILKTYLPEDLVAERHVQLLNATKMDHMVFPLGPEGEDDINFSGGKIIKTKSDGEEEMGENSPMKEFVERTTLTDQEIIEMLAEVNCKVRRIVHGETARHVYFWSADNTARDKALDKAYKLRGRYMDDPENPQPKIVNTYNFLFSEQTKEKVKEIEDTIKARLTNVQENKKDNSSEQ